jgi:hypothetical protein
MSKWFKWTIIGVIIAAVLGGSVYFGIQFFKYKEDVKVPEVKKSAEQILEENKAELNKVNKEKTKVSSKGEIYDIFHQMSNTLIVAEDGLIYGEIPINDESISQAMAMLNSTDLIDKSEKEVFLNILDAWKKKDYSNGVQAHNYAWKRLNGQIGRAKELRDEYKTKK